MSFLSKLKQRLFKSSSKIDQGIETLLDDETKSSENLNANSVIKESEVQFEHSNKSDNEKKTNEGLDSVSDGNGFLSKILKKKNSSGKKRVVDDKLLESLEELLISSDLGVSTAIKISASFAEAKYGQKLNKDEIKSALANEIKKILLPVAVPISISKESLQVMLVVGVNGSGKTTTIGKLANQFKESGKVVKIVAADTYRAAAVEQLEVWGSRADVPVIKTSEGGDPAALAYDAMLSSKSDGTEILIIDTAGRLQNKSDLMEQLAKIVRVISKADSNAPHATLLILDASIGQNAISQVDIFKKTADISGLVMTKLDGSAKGGVLVALADRFQLPVHAIGIGEGIDDLQPFDPEEFTIALTGAEDL